MRPLIAACAALALLSFAETSPARSQTPATASPPAGEYKLDRAHSSLNFRVNHIGMSHYTARFIRFDATLDVDPANPGAASVTADVDASSLQTNYPFTDFNFDEQLTGKGWLDAAAYPKMTFHSTKVEMTGPNTARVTGDFTMHGVTKPVVLEMTYNGGYGGNPYDPAGSRIGFSAHGTLNRSDFGVSQGIPAPGSTMGVSDAVEIIIEAEFTRPVKL